MPHHQNAEERAEADAQRQALLRAVRLRHHARLSPEAVDHRSQRQSVHASEHPNRLQAEVWAH